MLQLKRLKLIFRVKKLIKNYRKKIKLNIKETIPQKEKERRIIISK